MTALLLALALSAPPCDLRPLEREEKRLERIILSLQPDDRRLPKLFEEWDRAVAAVDSCKAKLAEEPTGRLE